MFVTLTAKVKIKHKEYEINLIANKLPAYNVVSGKTNLAKKTWLCMSLLTVLGTQGIVITCTSAIFFRKGN